MADPAVDIEQVNEVTPELIEAIELLVPQLSRSAPADADVIERVIQSPATTLFVARLSGRIIGMLTLATFTIPTGVRAWIEDVVVDEVARGRGVASVLVNAAVEHAKASGARTVDLTSRPERVDANRLYQRLGFARRETNVYRYSHEN